MGGSEQAVKVAPIPQVEWVSGAMPPSVQKALCLVLCLYPVIGVRHLPLGDSGRYLSVLAAPLSLLALLLWGRPFWQARLQDAIKAVLPFVPFALAYALACVWHGKPLGFSSVGERLVYGVLLVACARLVGLTRAQVLWAAALGGVAYGVSAGLEMLGMIFPQWSLHSTGARYYAEEGVLRAGGGGGNPIHFADAAMWLLGLGACAAYFETGQSTFRRWMLAACAMMAFLACLASQSRGALLALLALYGVMAAFALRKQHRMNLGAGMALLIVVFGVAVQQHWVGQRLLMVGNEVQQYLAQSTFTFSSVGARLEMWRLALLAVGPQWWTGLGVGSVSDVVARLPSAQALPHEMLRQPHFHNDLMQSLVLGGVLLASGMLVTLGLLLWQARKDPYLMWVVLAGICFGFSDLIFHQNTMFTMMVSTWCLLWATQVERSDGR